MGQGAASLRGQARDFTGQRQHGQYVAAILEHDLGAQPVHRQALQQLGGAHAFDVEQISPSCWASRKSNRYLPCGVSRAA